jgi:hypothetical protein
MDRLKWLWTQYNNSPPSHTPLNPPPSPLKLKLYGYIKDTNTTPSKKTHLQTLNTRSPYLYQF